MPDQQPANATDTPDRPRDEAAPGAVLNDTATDAAPGGGGLGGMAAADPLDGSARTPGDASPNAPIDTGVDAGDAKVSAEARVLATRDDAPEPR